MMPRNREQEAGVLYEQGAKAVTAGGHELHMLAGHLILMIQGTYTYPGALWPVRVLPPDNREIRLDRFIDYLRKPAREGLGLPSLHFLRRVLTATPNNGAQALVLVRQELAKEHINLDAVADRERDSELLRRMPGPEGRPSTDKPTNLVSLSTGGIDRQAAQLAKRRPDLADQVRAGKMKLSTALLEAGIRKKPMRRCPQCGHEW